MITDALVVFFITKKSISSVDDTQLQVDLRKNCARLLFLSHTINARLTKTSNMKSNLEEQTKQQ